MNIHRGNVIYLEDQLYVYIVLYIVLITELSQEWNTLGILANGYVPNFFEHFCRCVC
jgi:hypothetical protein